MLTDPAEIRIISQARQKNVRDPSRSRKHFSSIFDDFLTSVDFEGAALLDLRPGQYDFAEMARERGATTHGIDNDPAVVELGEYNGYPARLANLKDLQAADYDFRFDGVFCKYSINTFWFHDDDQRSAEYVRQIGRLIKPGGWAWIAPWNGVPKKADLSPEQVVHALSVQAEAFGELGFLGVDLTERLSKRYGVHGATANRALYLLNLTAPARLAKCQVLCQPAPAGGAGNLGSPA